MIVVTTPTGAIGGRVLTNLLDAGAPVRVIVRDPGKLPAEVRDRVEVVPGSHADPDVVAEAFAGADAVFWLVPPNPRSETLDAGYTGFSRAARDAFVAQGVGRVVGISALGRGTPMESEAGHVTATLALDDMIAATGVPYRALTMPSFMENILRQVPVIRDQGVYFGPTHHDLKAPACAVRDIAAAATTLLLDDTWTGHGEVPVLGPEDLSPDDMAAVMSDVLGRPVRYQQVSEDAFRDSLNSAGMSPAMVDGMVAMMHAKNNGLDNAAKRTAETSTPTTFRQWCEEVLLPAMR